MIKLQGEIELIDYDETLEVAHDGKVVYVDGKPQKLNKKKFCITCNVQPLGGRDLLMVPELDRYKEQYNLYVRGQPLSTNDRVKRCDKYFQVQSVESWGSYQLARIMLIDVGELSYD